MRKKMLLAIACVLLLLSTAAAEPGDTLWTRAYGGSDEDLSWSVQQTSDGGYIIAGETESFGAGGWDVYLVETDSLGDTLWTHTYGGSDWDWGYSVQQTSDGGYIIAGYTGSFGAGNYDVYLLKTDSSGDTLWTRTYGGSSEERGWSVQQTSDGGYVIAGYTHSFGGGNDDVWLLKTGSSGDTLWTRTYGGSDYDVGYSVQETSDGGYIIAGYTESFGAGYRDFYLVKTDSSGDTLWTRTYGGSDYDWSYSVQQTSDGGYIIAGYTESFGAGRSDVYLVKTDSSGDTVCTRTYGGSSDDYGYSVQQTSDGGYIVAGMTESFGAGGDDVYLLKTDSSGDTLWTRTYGGGSWDDAYSVQQTSDGGYIIAGYTDSFGAGASDVYLLKTDSSGDTLWTRTYGGSSGDLGRSVKQTSDGGYVIAGYTDSFGAGNYDVYLLKTDSSGDSLWTRAYGGSSSDYGYSVQQTSAGGYIIAGQTWSFGAGYSDVYLVCVTGHGSVVESDGESKNPVGFSLWQNYPNPFNAMTVIEYELPAGGQATLAVYNLVGQRLATLVEKRQQPGYRSIIWDASDFSSGVYFYRLTAGDFTETKRMILVK